MPPIAYNMKQREIIDNIEIQTEYLFHNKQKTENLKVISNIHWAINYTHSLKSNL